MRTGRNVIAVIGVALRLYCEKVHIIEKLKGLLSEKGGCSIFRSLVLQNGGKITLETAFSGV